MQLVSYNDPCLNPRPLTPLRLPEERVTSPVPRAEAPRAKPRAKPRAPQKEFDDSINALPGLK